MALTPTITFKSVFGNRRIVIGTATVASGDTTGNIVTGLSHIDYAEVHYKDLADKTIQTDITTTEGTIACTFTNPGATKNLIWIAIGI